MYTSTLLAGIVTIIVCLKQWSAARRRKSLPPGPRGLPFVGNTFDWSESKPWITLTEWANKYGDIVYAKVAGDEFVIVNSVDTATALLQGRSAQYSDRPPQHFIGKMAGFDPILALRSDGPELHEQRRVFMKGMGTRKAVEVFDSRMEKWVVQFVQSALKSPNLDILGLARRLAGITILDVTYGYKVSNQDEDELLSLAIQVITDWSVGAAPGIHLVNTFTWLERLPGWLPGMGFKEEAAGIRKRWMHFAEWPFKFTRDQQRNGTAIPSVITAYTDNKDVTPENELALKWAVAAMSAGGTDTTASSMTYFVQYMLQYPHVQARAQEEIDALLGGARLPTARDVDVLPYTCAILSEVLRLGTVAPLGLVHQVRENDMFEGFLIPKGAIVIPNIYLMSRDPKNYNNPHVFNPDRFLGEHPELDPRKYVFGFGKRICPGRMLAEINLFLLIATCFSTVTFLKAKDQDGNEIEPSGDWDGLTITCPESFACQVTPRSEQSIVLLQSASL